MLAEREERVLLFDPYNPLPEKSLEFRLVYGGQLLGASRDDTRSQHKHEIRRVFHDQLKILWQKSANLREWECPNLLTGKLAKVWENAAAHYQLNGVGYVPLSFDGLGVACKLDILMLRPEAPGQTLIKGGDVDNRLKTLFDALRIPKAGERMESPDDEGARSPFFCLLEDDSLINHLSVTTDLLLGDVHPNEVRLVIAVNLWNVVHTTLNMGIF